MNLLIAMLISMGLIEHDGKIYVIDKDCGINLIDEFEIEEVV